MEKISLVNEYRFRGLQFVKCLEIVGITKHQFYHKPNGKKSGKRATSETKFIDSTTNEEQMVNNEKVLDEIIAIKQDTDQPDYYKLICVALCLKGYFINHKKVFRLMREQGLLLKRIKLTGKRYVKYKRAVPLKPLEILEMDIKYVWVSGSKKYAYVLTILDTFTRCALCFSVGFSMKTPKVKEAWEFVTANYLQGNVKPDIDLHIEVRNDNGKQFSSEEIQQFFADNYLTQVFTHPYTPEENGHIESFHSTLGKALKNDSFDTLNDLENRLDRFYANYNNERTHSTTIVPPSVFWGLYERGFVMIISDLKSKIMKFKINMKLQEVYSINGIKKLDNWVIRA
jgi:transposase InsO family protein